MPKLSSKPIRKAGEAGEGIGSASRTHVRVRVMTTGEQEARHDRLALLDSQQKVNDLIKRAGRRPLGIYQTLKFMSARERSHFLTVWLGIS